MITNYLGSGFGQLLLPVFDPAEFQLFCVASIFYSLALVPVLPSRAQAPQLAQAVRANFALLWRTSPLGLIGACCAGLNNAAFLSPGAVYAQRVGLNIEQTSLFMGAVLLGGLLMQWPVGRLSDRIDRRWVLVLVGLAASAASIGLAVAGGGSLIYLAAIIYGGGCFTVDSVCVAHTNDFVDPTTRVQTASGLLMAYSSGDIIGPILVGVLMNVYQAQVFFLYTAVVL
ncbi:MAG: MFS family permease [Gammaproteobacteria bacterium]|jgi:MFS family permease